jgi:Fe(II)/alpha-ketoglutarate-dependent arginine beta-hydroxylase
MRLARMQLDTAAAAALFAAAGDLLADAVPFDDPSAHRLAADGRHPLPPAFHELVRRLHAPDDPTAAVLVSGVPLGGLATLPTPRSLGAYGTDPRSRLVDAELFLLGAAVGVPFRFASQQQARLFLDVVPLAGHETDQLGCSSTAVLDWHNEDAFHPRRADYSLLMCVRNGQSAATRLVAAADLRLAEKTERHLRNAQFAIVPDVSHTYAFNVSTSGVAAGSAPAFAEVTELAGQVPRRAVLSGDPGDPRICVDFAYMPPELHSPAARSALATLRRALDAAGTAVPLAPGDVLVFDNHRCVHGREAFRARYDGTDRWMRRMNIARG